MTFEQNARETKAFPTSPLLINVYMKCVTAPSVVDRWFDDLLTTPIHRQLV